MSTPSLKFDASGLITAVVQDRLTGQVRMVAWMNEAALSKTQESGLATFYSRSRGKLWVKGETSGNRLLVREVLRDCDGDTLLLLVDPEGPSCHTGRQSCFFQPLEGEEIRSSEPFLTSLERIVQERESSTASKSYTKSLLSAGPKKLAEKIREEAGELAEAIVAESGERVLSEAGDVLFHLMVGLRSRSLAFRDVLRVLASRMGQSGHEEKASRTRD